MPIPGWIVGLYFYTTRQLGICIAGEPGYRPWPDTTGWFALTCVATAKRRHPLEGDSHGHELREEEVALAESGTKR